jgi:perosamine synthetase
MAVTRLGKSYWGSAEVAAVLRGVVNPGAAGATRDALAKALRDLGYDAPLYLTSQGSVALALALEEMRAQRPGKSVVVVPAYCCPSVPDVVRALGLTLRAAPVRPDLNLDLDAIEPLLKPDVLAVVGVHMYGLPIDVVRLKAMAQKVDAYVVDDAAHVVGLASARPQLGMQGDVGLLSFHHSKTLTGGSPNGGGALIVTNPALNAGVARRFAELPEGRSPLGYHVWFALRYAIEVTPRALMQYIVDPFYDLIVRWCGIERKKPERLGASAGKAVLAQLARLRTIIEGRRRIFADYIDILKATPGLELVQTKTPQSLSRVVVRWQGGARADDVREQLLRKGFATRQPYPMWTEASDPTAPVVARIVATHLELPASPVLRRAQLESVVRTLLPLVEGRA